MGSDGVRKDPGTQPGTPRSGISETPRRRVGRRLALILFLAVVVSLLGLYASRNRVLPALARFLDVSEPVEATDYVMVLGGDVDTRPFVAAALLKAGRARKALMGNIRLSADSEDGVVASEQELTRAVLERQGTPPAAIALLPGKVCVSTFDEACALAAFLDSEPHSSVTVVTSCYHTRRVRMIFRKVLGEHAVQVRFCGAPTDGFNESNWWCFEGGLLVYLNEYFKLAYYLVRY